MIKMKGDPSLIHGSVAPGFEEVEREFSRNFGERGEVGAACAIYHQGQKVVDLWGGYRDAKSRAPWEEDTLVLVFSTTKGLAAMTMAVAHSRGLFDYDAPVATYWPEFVQQGKEHITIRQLLSHQAGLSAIDEPLTLETLSNLDALARIIAKQRPAWEPGTRHGYNAFSLGSCEGELIRRVDPLHRSLGKFFQEEIARPLGLEFYIGVPATIPEARIATIKSFHPFQMLWHMNTLPRGMVMAYLNPKSLTHRSLLNPKVRTPGDFNRPAWRAVEIPAGGGIGQVRSIAKAYSVFATGGHELGISKPTLDALTTPATPPSLGIHDEVLHINTCFSLGFFKPSADFPFGSSVKAFGTNGAGGSFGYADPDAQISFAYAPNRMGFYMWNDPREKVLRDALYRCLKKRRDIPETV
jgi:CubicO group peptidase (beta-lactamase class C family)